MRESGRAIGRDISKGEAVEHELDAFISKRAAARVRDEGERPAEEAWMESERRHEARRRAEIRVAWTEYHREQAERHRRVLASLVAFHEREAEKYLPKGAA